MELILGLYMLDYNAEFPILCFDERPCFLIGDVVSNIEMRPCHPAKEHYAYSKHGSCCVLAAIEPKTGKRLAHVRKRRTKREFTMFMQNLAGFYPDAKKIIIVMDNLNTHNFSSFYEHLSADEAANLMDRFEFVYTPKRASWLNMIEIEFSALSRQCLNRRIPNINQLATEVMTYFKKRTDLGIRIDWQFSRENARQKLNRHYAKANPLNTIYK